jgi:hypothetical protein
MMFIYAIIDDICVPDDVIFILSEMTSVYQMMLYLYYQR